MGIRLLQRNMEDAVCTFLGWELEKMIMKKLLRTENLKIHSVREAMEAMIKDGITEVVVQPTHVINGIENDLMKKDALAYADSFAQIRFGAPLLTSEQDNNEVVQAVAEAVKSHIR